MYPDAASRMNVFVASLASGKGTFSSTLVTAFSSKALMNAFISSRLAGASEAINALSSAISPICCARSWARLSFLVIPVSIGRLAASDGSGTGGASNPRSPVRARLSLRLLLTALRQQLLQHAANVGANLSVAGSLRLAVFAVTHRFSPLATAAVFAPLLSIVIAIIPENVA